MAETKFLHQLILQGVRVCEALFRPGSFNSGASLARTIARCRDRAAGRRRRLFPEPHLTVKTRSLLFDFVEVLVGVWTCSFIDTPRPAPVANFGRSRFEDNRNSRMAGKFLAGNREQNNNAGFGVHRGSFCRRRRRGPPNARRGGKKLSVVHQQTRHAAAVPLRDTGAMPGRSCRQRRVVFAEPLSVIVGIACARNRPEALNL